MDRLRNVLNRPVCGFLTVFLASALRFLYYGFQYFPQLDDYIQYHNYELSDDYALMIEKLGLLASRPLAGLSDFYVWSLFWGKMIVAVLLLCAMWAASAMLFRAVFDRYFGCSMFFTVVYALLPLGFEGTYWVSASTRVVTGMFFTSLALYLFDRMLQSKKWLPIPLWMLCQLLSYGYYEQTLVLSLFLTLLIAFLARRNRRAWFGLLSFANAAIYFAFTNLFASGALTSRMQLALPTSLYYFQSFLPDISNQIFIAFAKCGVLTLFKGFARGAGIIITDGAWLYVLLTAAVTALFCLIPHDKPSVRSGSPIAILYAVLIAAAPVSIFFFIANPWFSLRNTVPAYAGIALLADILLRLITRNRHTALASAILTALCLTASVSELSDYRDTYVHDDIVVKAISDTLDGSGKKVGILNLNASYLTDQNCYHNEHIHGVTESGWALTGAIGARADSVKIADSVVPLATDTYTYYSAWNRDMKRPDSYDMLYWWDEPTQSLTLLTLSGDAETGWTLCSIDGIKYAYIYEEEGYGYVDIAER